MRSAFFAIALALAATGRPMRRQNAVDLQNGQEAIALNQRFATLTANSPCTAPEDACVNGGFAQCVGGRFVIQQCAPGTVCAALPQTNARGTITICTTAADRDARIAATGAEAGGAAPPPAGNNAGEGAAPGANNGNNNNGGNNGNNNNNDNNNGNNNNDNNNGGNNNGGNNNDNNGGGNNNDDPQTSLTLDPDVIATGFANDGQDVPSAGQVASLTSTNNFINFCKTVSLPITNGQQITTGSCNPAPMGAIPSKDRMPSSKFTNPLNGATIQANVPFNVQMAIRNLETGNFVNAQQNYFSAPQQLNGQGIIRGHSHVVIEPLPSLDSTVPLDNTKFSFFKGLNGAAENGILTASADKGLPAGFYRLSSINSASNHQPVLVPIAQHGSLDDVIYFTVA